MAIPMQGGSRRRHIRLTLYEGVTAELRVLGIRHYPIHSRAAKALILDLSPGGLRFATPLRFADDVEWLVGLQFMLQGVRLEVRGVIRHSTADPQWREYGVEMDVNPLMRMMITRVLNSRIIKSSPELARMHQAYGRFSLEE
ncbi:PilZ domain-containing protein [Cohnella pontilimi]|nr:PilZ domain-containing protein [Cohnella pontilimi]